MAVRFTCTVPSYNGAEFVIDIYDSAFSDTATEFDIAEDSLIIDRKGGQERHDPFQPTECSFTMMIAGATEEALITDLAGAAEGRFSVRIEKDGNLHWCGVILADIARLEDSYYPYHFEVTATDGIGALKDIEYKNGSNSYTGDARLVSHVLNCLGKLPHVATFYDASTEQFLRTSIDWWEDSMTKTAAADPLYLTWLSHATFYKYDSNTTDKRHRSCYEVLETVLKTFGARISFHEGTYWIEQISVRSSDSFYTRRYTRDGTALVHETYSTANTLNQTAAGARLRGGVREFFPPLQYARVEFLTYTRQNYLSGYAWNDGATSATIYKDVNYNGGSASMQLTGNLRITYTNDSYTGSTNDQLIFVFEIRIVIGGKAVLRQYTIQNFSVNYGNTTWETDTGSNAASIAVSTWPTPSTGNTATFNYPVSFSTPPLQASGTNMYFEIDLVNIKKYNGDSVFLGDFTISWTLENPWLEIYTYGHPSLNEDSIVYHSVNGSTTNSSIYEVETLAGDGENVNTIGKLKIGTSSAALTDAAVWGAGSDTPALHIGELLAETIIAGQLTPIKKAFGTFYGDFTVWRRFNDGTTSWLLLSGRYNCLRDEIDGEWFETNYGSSGYSTTKIKKQIKDPWLPPFHLGTIKGVNTGSGVDPELVANPQSTVLAPVANTATTSVKAAGSVTSLPVGTLSSGDFGVGDALTIVNPITGAYDTLSVTATSTTGDTDIAVTGTLSYDYPIGSYIIKSTLSGTGAGISVITNTITTGSNSVDVPAGKVLEYFTAIHATDSGVLIVGTTNGGSEILDYADFDTAGYVNQVMRYFDTATTLYFTGFTGSITIKMKVA